MENNIEVYDIGRGTESIEIKSRTYYSLQHIQSAALFTRLCANIEKNYNGVFNDELFSEHRAYVTGTILSVVSFLEAAINEIFADIADGINDKITNCFNLRSKIQISSLWDMGIPRTASYPILEKYQIALLLADKKVLDKGKNPFQDVLLIIKLRNSLTHYEPEWITHQLEDNKDSYVPHDFEKKLKSKFPLNPLLSGNPFYPDKCLGYGCAEWAVVSGINFADEFFKELGAIPRYEHIRGRLKTK
jgi:hypothetical protein